ncbi:MAG: hypothetical protein AABZ43_02465, partial [Planctomycetota bacterium]
MICELRFQILVSRLLLIIYPHFKSPSVPLYQRGLFGDYLVVFKSVGTVCCSRNSRYAYASSSVRPHISSNGIRFEQTVGFH